MKSYTILLVSVFVAFTSYSQNLLSQQQSERKFSQGLELLDHKQYGAAREVFSEFIAFTPSADVRRADAEYYVAFCALNLYHGDAEKQIESLATPWPVADNPVMQYQ